MPQAKEILEAALRLDSDERAVIAEELWASLDRSPDESVEKAWAREVESRIKDLDEGRVKSVPLDEARARIAESLRRGRAP
jgi:putative addiction module component (TIGR02574 family)